MKVHSAASGYVYHYFYLGWRPAQGSEAPGSEFVFDVSADRRSYHPVSVFVPATSVQPWEAARGRTLVPAEIYAVAKMALFQAFDERPGPGAMDSPVRVRPADAGAILDQLDV